MTCHLNNVDFVLADPTLERVIFEIINSNQATTLTAMNSICITLVKEFPFENLEPANPSANNAQYVPILPQKLKPPIVRDAPQLVVNRPSAGCNVRI
ncbi:hypothetical protein Tco_1062611 [Tanacetum coccineum]